ncbi:MAG TPA: SIMPL domain-containing protein [Clostridiaceae bacterium]|nr:SIMPL domain-containing protein [Clostridiaceae bacterium]
MFVQKIFKGRILLIAFTAILLLAFCVSAQPDKAYAEGEQTPTKRTMSVSGQGIVYASPDIAYVSLGIVTENADAKAAQQENAEIMSKIVDAIKAEGIKAQDIKTERYYISPKYSYDKDTGENKIVGYTVTNSVQVTIRDISKTGAIIDLAADSGANISTNISFGLSDYEKYYNEALKIAVEKAKKRAQTIASVLGVTIDVPVSVSESGGYEPIYSYNYNYSYDIRVDEAEAVPTPIESGTITVRANVHMVYEY